MSERNVFEPICARHCSVCEGADHHWMPDCDESGEPIMVCKHCDAERDYPDCETCDDSGFAGHGSGYGDVCPDCGGQSRGAKVAP